MPPKVEEILDRFEYVVHHARHVPLSNQVMVDEDEVMELVDQLRFNLPEEINQARWTMQEQQRLISEAHAEAARIMARANEAQAKCDQIIREAETYALEQLKQLEAHLSRTLATVKRGVEALQSAPAAAVEDGHAVTEEAPAR